MSEESTTVTATASSSWLSLALQLIQQSSHLNNDLCDVLRAFGDDDAPGQCNLNPNSDGSTKDVLQHRISTELLTEIDADQAMMFGRRFASVSTLLQENYTSISETNNQQSVTTKQLLCLALHRRTVQILTTTDPILSQRKALRIRALVDFIWSQSLVLDLRDDPQNNRLTLTELVHKHELHSCTSTQYNEFAPGFYHATLDDISKDFGPLHINILRINTNNVQMKCLDARQKCTDLSTLAKNEGAYAGISGGFFLYSEPDIESPSKRTDPVGLLIEEGDIYNPPVFQRSSIFQKENSSIGIDKMGMEGVTCTFLLESEKDSMSLKLTIGQDNVRCVHRGDDEFTVIQEDECAFQIIGRAITRLCLSPTEKFPVPLAGFVLIFTKSSHPNAIKVLLDDSLAMSITYQLPAPCDSINSAMAGGPMFFSDESESHIMDLPSEDFKKSAPPLTFSQDETHDHNLLPRMGVGLAKCSKSGNDQLVCVAIDGRNLDRALGLTLQGTADLLRSLGCYKAMNLDGGSSKRMVIYYPQQKLHKVVCLSTTEIKASNNGGEDEKVEPSRPVHAAILFLPKK